jgi:hypothetical protein
MRVPGAPRLAVALRGLAAAPATVGTMSMEGLSQAVERLTAAGYRAGFRAEPGGLRAVGSDCVHAPETLVVEEVLRFEGASDPDDQATLFALRCATHGVRGTYVVAWGPGMDPLDAEMVRRLREGRAR